MRTACKFSKLVNDRLSTVRIGRQQVHRQPVTQRANTLGHTFQSVYHPPPAYRSHP